MFFFFFPEYLILKDSRWTEIVHMIEAAHKKYPDMTINALRTFMYFAINQDKILNEKVSIRQIAKELDITYTTITRQVDILGDGIGGRGGQGLLEKITEGKKKRVELTADGMKLMSEMYKSLARVGLAEIDNRSRPLV